MREVDSLTETISRPGYELEPSARHIAIEGFKTLDEIYGEGSANHLFFHNADHSLGHTRRGVELTNLLIDDIPPEYQEFIYELILMDGAWHDRVQGQKEFGLNERLSAMYLIAQIATSGDTPINTQRTRIRAHDGVIVSTAYLEQDANVVQPYLGEGEPDPLKFIEAFVDVDAIAMEGIVNMLDTTRKLVKENYENPTPSHFYGFAVNEKPFLRKRLNNIRMKSFIARYFPGAEDSVFDKMWDAFHDNIVAAHAFAEAIEKNFERSGDIGEAIAEREFEVVGEIVGLSLETPKNE